MAMSAATRNLFAYAVTRNASEKVDMYFDTSTENLDGSYSVVQKKHTYRARMVDLTPDEIQRLQEGGITLHSGASVAIPIEFEIAPDSLIWNGNVYKIMQSTLSENCSVFVIDKAAIGFASVEVGA